MMGVVSDDIVMFPLILTGPSHCENGIGKRELSDEEGECGDGSWGSGSLSE